MLWNFVFATPNAVNGKRIIVYDDICTTGLQLNASRSVYGSGALYRFME